MSFHCLIPLVAKTKRRRYESLPSMFTSCIYLYKYILYVYIYIYTLLLASSTQCLVYAWNMGRPGPGVKRRVLSSYYYTTVGTHSNTQPIDPGEYMRSVQAARRHRLQKEPIRYLRQSETKCKKNMKNGRNDVGWVHDDVVDCVACTVYREPEI